MDDNFVKRVQEIRIGDKYQLLRRLGSGTFGTVYLGRDVGTGTEVAIKLEHHTIEPGFLEDEARIYRCLPQRPGFPRVYWLGHLEEYTILVFELLGPNLADLFQYCGNKFSLKTTLMLADQLLHLFEVLHSHHYLHRDVKPENFLLGPGTHGSTVYMTNLGLAVEHDPEHWSPPISLPSKAPVEKSRLMGTCRYASISGHLGIEQSRRDDLEALGYMLVYFVRGKLPWQVLNALKGTAREMRVLELKKTTSVSEICADLPAEFSEYINYVDSLRGQDAPDYRYLRDLFRKLYHRQGFDDDDVFDWTILEFLRLEAQSQQSPASDDLEVSSPGSNMSRASSGSEQLMMSREDALGYT